MPIALAPSPTRAGPTATGSLTSGSFTANAGTVLLCCVSIDSATNTDTLTGVSGGSLSWTEIARRSSAEAGMPGAVGAWWAPVPTGRALTVTASASTTNRLVTHKVFVLTGVNTSVIGAVAEGDQDGDPLTTNPLTTLHPNSWVWCVANESRNGDNVPSVSGFDVADLYVMSGDASGVAGARAVPAAGTSTSFAASAANASSLTDWTWIAFETRAAPAGDGGAGRRRRLMPLLAR